MRAPYLNGKVERLFRTFRGWWRWTLPCLTIRGLQRKLDIFRGWYNQERVHAALDGRTPMEAWDDVKRPDPVLIRARDCLEPQITVTRRHCRGDPRLPIVDITIRLRNAA